MIDDERERLGDFYIEDDHEPIPLNDAEKAQQTEEVESALIKLTLYGVVLTVVVAGIAAIAALLGVNGAASFAKGAAVGGAVCVLNLNAIGRSTWAMFRGEKLWSSLGFLSSLLLLAGAGFFIGQVRNDWVLGFAIGLAMPIPVGFWFAKSLLISDENDA